ncbi:hypothetical protein [Enterococcus sp. AZ007]|uniref:hypothetical protein n=1 Tax=Enterococcus sp. AZ007 TaxID=2774839 RepID=UPI003F2608AF
MNFVKMKIDELKAYLDEHNVDYSNAKIKGDFVQLAEIENAKQNEEPEKETEDTLDTNVSTDFVEESETDKPASLAEKVKSAIKIERTETKKVDDVSYLNGRDYSQLTVGERAVIREQSPEYSNQETGVQVAVTDRLPTKWRIVKLADKSYAKLIKSAKYTLSQADFEGLKDEQVKVKTEATKNKCCGQARYETIALLEVLDD